MIYVKKIILFMVSALMVFCVACGQEPEGTTENLIENDVKTSEEDTTEYVIPESYLAQGFDPQEIADACMEKGPDYCTNARVEGNTVILELTDTQRLNFIEKNNEEAKVWAESYLQADENYRIEGSDDYKEITFYCDEKVPLMALSQASGATIQSYGLNQILEENSGQWSVHVSIVNCHTGKIVVEGDLPQEELIFTPNDWTESYTEE